MVKHRSIAAVLGCLFTIGVATAHAAEGASPEIDGKALLQKTCARCHSIEATGDSPLKGAPPLREVYLKYPIEMLQYDLAEAPSIATALGVGKVWVKHESSRSGLPAFQFLGASWAVYRALLK
jgi:cytochrome c553